MRLGSFVTYQPSIKELSKLGWNIIPIAPNTKVPLVKWKANQLRRYTGAFPSGCSYAAIMGKLTGFVVLDTDSLESEKLLASKVPFTGLLIKTRKGYHRYYRWPGYEVPTMLGFDRYGKADLKADRSYTLIPPSPNYEWINFDLEQVPDFCFEWLEVHTKKTEITLSETKTYGVQEIDSLLASLRAERAILSAQVSTRSNIYVKTAFKVLDEQGYKPIKEKAGPMKSSQPHTNGMMIISPTGLAFISNAGGLFCKINLNLSSQIKLYQILKTNQK